MLNHFRSWLCVCISCSLESVTMAWKKPVNWWCFGTHKVLGFRVLSIKGMHFALLGDMMLCVESKLETHCLTHCLLIVCGAGISHFQSEADYIGIKPGCQSRGRQWSHVKSCRGKCKIRPHWCKSSCLFCESHHMPFSHMWCTCLTKVFITKVILQSNGTFRWEWVPYEFPLVAMHTYNVNNIFPLVVQVLLEYEWRAIYVDSLRAKLI